MSERFPFEIPDEPRLSENIMHFCRALRRAGLPIGSGRVIDAIRAVEAAGFTDRSDFFFALRACLVSRPEHLAVFEQIFRLFWRDPRFMERMMAQMLPAIRGVQEERVAGAAAKRAAEALLDGAFPDMQPRDDRQEENVEVEMDASLTMSMEERLRTMDFEQMSVDEIAQAKRMLARLSLPVEPIASRRKRAAANGSWIDPAATMRMAMRRGGELRDLLRVEPRVRWPNLIALCDISGSMSRYSRILLHFLHTVANAKGQGWAQVHAFTFGTRLTNITRLLRQRDVDTALSQVGAEARDWEGGTRIGQCLHAFNRDWSRRVMGHGAVTILISDGLDRDDPVALSCEMERLRLSSRRLVWLNPLLRWDGFVPKAVGIRAMLPYVDSIRAGHSVASIGELAAVISRSDDVGFKARLMNFL